MHKMNDDEEMLKDNLVAACYCLPNVNDESDTIDSIALRMIEEGVSDLDIGMLAIFVEKLLTFYASDEAVPLLEKNFPEGSTKISQIPKVIDNFNDVYDMNRLDEFEDFPFEANEAPTDKDLEEIEQAGFLENLWEEGENRDKELADFSMGFEEPEEVEPDLSKMTRRERKKWKKAQRAARKKREAALIRNRDFGFDKFETNNKKEVFKKEFKPVINYEFDTISADDAEDSEIGDVTKISKFEAKSESKTFVFGTPVKKASFNTEPPVGLLPGMPRLPEKIIGNGWDNPHKRRWDWDTTPNGCP